MYCLGSGDVDSGGEYVVGRLTHVDVVVGVYEFLVAAFSAEKLVCPVGDDLVHVDVGHGTASSLEDV